MTRLLWPLLVLVACSGDSTKTDTTDTDTDTDTGDTGPGTVPVALECGAGAEIGFERVAIPYTSDFYGYGYMYGYSSTSAGWDGVVYDTREEWEALAQLAGFSDPIPTVDFDTNDVVLYGWVYGGCGEELLFLGACSDGTTRDVVVMCDPNQHTFCDGFFPRIEVLVVAEDAGADLTVTTDCG